MKLFKKTLLYSSIFACVAAFSGFLFLQKTREDEGLRENTLHYMRIVKNFVYREATIYNPKGDMLPDQVDDTIISELKMISN